MGKSTGKHNIYAILAGQKTDISPYEGTATANKAVVLDSNKAVSGLVLSDVVSGCVMTVGTQGTATIIVALQFNNGLGTPMTAKTSARYWFTTDSTGLAVSGGPDSLAAGTDGFIIADGGDSVVSGVVVSEEDGDADIAITDANVITLYLNVQLPNGTIVTSDAITFTSTT